MDHPWGFLSGGWGVELEKPYHEEPQAVPGDADAVGSVVFEEAHPVPEVHLHAPRSHLSKSSQVELLKNAQNTMEKHRSDLEVIFSNRMGRYFCTHQWEGS